MARGDFVDGGKGKLANRNAYSGFVWRYANTATEAINSNSDIIEIFPYIWKSSSVTDAYSNDLRNSYVQITIGGTTTTQYLKTKYNFGNASTNTNYYLTSNYGSGYPFGYGTPSDITYITSTSINSKTAYGARFPVPHNTDGTAPSVTVKWVMVNSSTHGNAEVTTSLTLDDIPRASQPTCSNTTLGVSTRINTNRVSSSFTHTLRIKMGSTTVETFNNIGEYKDWTPTLADYLSYIPSSTGTATIECTTYNNGTQVGSVKTTTCTLTVPNNSDTKPSVSISIAEGGSLVPNTWGVYVQGKSKLAVTLTGTHATGTSISTYISSVNGSAYSTSSYTTSEITVNGHVKAQVKDGRGFYSSEVTKSFTVEPYSNPQISLTVNRCNSSGTLDDSGTYVKYSCTGTISSVSNKNSKTYTFKYKEKNAGTWTTISDSTWNSSYSLNKSANAYGSGTIDITKEYIFRLEAEDEFNSDSGVVFKEVEIGTVADLMNFNASGKSMAIGAVSQRGANESALDVMIPLYAKETIVESIRSKNMLNINTIINGKLNTSTGAYETSDYILVSNYIYMKSGTYTIKINNPNSFYLHTTCSYNSSKTYVSTLWQNTTSTQKTFTLNNDRYVRFCFRKDNYPSITPSEVSATNIQLEEGSSATTYYPYQNLTGMENYSTSEVKIGTWYTGKTLYRKVIIFTYPSGSTTLSLDTNTPNVEDIKKINSTIYKNGKDFETPWYWSASDNLRIFFRKGTPANTLEVRSSSATSNDYTITTILEYTKTTD